MRETLKSDLILFVAAFIWGVTFLVQKDVTDTVGAFSFTSIRFLLAAIFLTPFALRQNPLADELKQNKVKLILFLLPAFLLGPILSLGSAIQQWGLEYTSEANAGFITTFYVILTPIFAYILGSAIKKTTWIAAILMLIGLYFLSFEKGFDIKSINKGDFLTLICAVFWAMHIIAISYVIQYIPALWIAVAQNFSCALFSLIVATIFEDFNINTFATIIPQVLWAGVVSVGIAYTLQIVGQKRAPATHAVIILSLEAVIAAIAAMIYYQELMSPRAIFGAILMFCAVIVAELVPILQRQKNTSNTV